MTYKILFADDSTMINQVMSFTLENNDFTVETSNNKEEIEEKIKSTSFDLIIISQLLDGINFAKKIRSSKFNKNVQLFILSKDSDINEKKIAKQNNVDGWITKPFIPEKLVKTLKFYMNKTYKNKK